MAKSVVLNHRAVAFARNLIAAGHVQGGQFAFTAADKHAILGNPPDWKRYSKYFLAEDKSATPNTEGRYKYPFAKLHVGKAHVFTHALANAASRASAQHLPEVSAAASKLLVEANKKNPKRIHKATMGAKARRTVHLFTPVDSEKIKIDPTAGTIDNVAIMTIGPARGHDFWIDATTLQQMLEMIQALKPIRNRWTHPILPDGQMKDDTGTLIGHIDNPRIDGDTLRGTITLGEFAKSVPGLGNIWQYLIGDGTVTGLVQASPQDIGLSPVIGIDYETRTDASGMPLMPAGRVKTLAAIDWVSEPAGNPEGLLSVAAGGTVAGEGDQATVLTPQLLEILFSEYGLDPKSNIQSAKQFFEELPISDQQDAIDKATALVSEETLSGVPQMAKRLKVHQAAKKDELAKKLADLAAEHGAKLGKGDLDAFSRKLASTIKAPDDDADSDEDAESPAAPTDAADADDVGADETPDAGAADDAPVAPEPQAENLDIDEDEDEVAKGVGGGDTDTSNIAANPMKAKLKKLADESGASLSDSDLEEMAKKLSKRALSRRIDPGTQMVNAIALRAANIRKLGGILQIPEDVIVLGVRECKTVEEARVKFLQYAAKQNAAIKNLSVGPDMARVAMRSAMVDAVYLHAGNTVGPGKTLHENAAKYQSMSLLSLGRHYLSAAGVREVEFMPDTKVARMLLNRRTMQEQIGFTKWVSLAESTGDFPGILVDAINKTLQTQYVAGEKTWPKFCRKGSARDFKTINRPNLSDIPLPISRAPGQEINYVTLTDTNEKYVLGQSAGGIKLTWQAIINDDKDAFARIPAGIGSTLSTFEERTVYAVLANNGLMADGNPLFSAAHGNLTATGSGGAPSVSQIQNGYTAITTQTGPQGMQLALLPNIVIVPATLAAVSQQAFNSSLLISTVSTSGSATQVGNENPWAKQFELIITPYLTGTAWYMMVKPGSSMIDTIEVSFLDGEPEPVVKQETDFDTDDLKLAYRHTIGAKALNWRGLYENAGA
ncbi:MAG: hypothetical protein ACP5I8_13280 [Phycisphaerae bacterium]